MGHTVGIDLGTTFSAVAKVGELGKPEILGNRDGENVLPSVVLFQDETPIVGTMAKRSAASAPLDVVQFVKRSMGDSTWRFETTAGTSYRPEEISAIILRRLKEDAELILGGEVTDAVITVPAYFDDAPRRATMDAGKIAGLNVRRVLNEPTAAALAYGVGQSVDGSSGAGEGTVLVYDLGGGTFDVTLMRISGGEFDVLGTHGDRNLGGFDFDNALMQLLDERYQAEGGSSLLDDDQAEADLRDKAEIAKHSLTTVEQTRVMLAKDGVSKMLTVTRSEFEDITSGLVGRTRDIAEMVVEDAGLGWSQVDRLLLAGGSTRMPIIRSMLTDLTGIEPERAINPDEVVALGAAIQAHLTDVEDVAGTPEAAALPVLAGGMTIPRVRDVTSQGLGTIAVKRGSEDQDDTENFVIIEANSKIPARASQVFVTLAEQQSTLRVEVTQGDDADPAYVRMIGEQTLVIPRYPKGAPFEVDYAYDVDQIVQIEVIDKTTGQSVGTFEVHNVANMDDAEVAEATSKLNRLQVS